jgi:hypothetical protein
MEDLRINFARYAIGFFGVVILVALAIFAGLVLRDFLKKIKSS